MTDSMVDVTVALVSVIFIDSLINVKTDKISGSVNT